MTSSVIAAQMFTLREFTQTKHGMAEALRKVKELGYEAVQLSAHGPIDPKDIRKILDETGLTVVVTHTPWERIKNDTDAVIAEHKLWNCKYVGVGAMPEEYRNLEGYYQFAREVNEVAKRLADQGLKFGYHNHSFEFEKFNGKTGMEILCDETDPELVSIIVDTYWIQHGGGDPAQWILNLKDRVEIVHLKDMVIQDGRQMFAEVGEGNMNWPRILEACAKAGTEWYVVEQDICQRDPFESLGISLRNLHQLGLK